MEEPDSDEEVESDLDPAPESPTHHRYIVKYNSTLNILLLDNEEILMTQYPTDKGYTCPICSQNLRSADFFIAHVSATHNYDRIYKCTRCSASYDTHSNLLQHIRSHDAVLAFECDEYSKAFAKQVSLREHMVRHGERTQKCMKYPLAFLEKKELIAHMRIVHLTRQLHCKQCAARFLTETERVAHVNIKHRGMTKGHKYAYCWKAYVLYFGLQKHLEAAHPNSFQCQICPETLSRKDDAAGHYRKAHGFVEEDDDWLLTKARESLDEDVVMG